MAPLSLWQWGIPKAGGGGVFWGPSQCVCSHTKPRLGLGGGRSILAAPNACLLPKFGRTAGSRRKPPRPGELALSLRCGSGEAPVFL